MRLLRLVVPAALALVACTGGGGAADPDGGIPPTPVDGGAAAAIADGGTSVPTTATDAEAGAPPRAPLSEDAWCYAKDNTCWCEMTPGKKNGDVCSPADTGGGACCAFKTWPSSGLCDCAATDDIICVEEEIDYGHVKIWNCNCGVGISDKSGGGATRRRVDVCVHRIPFPVEAYHDKGGCCEDEAAHTCDCYPSESYDNKCPSGMKVVSSCLPRTVPRDRCVRQYYEQKVDACN